MHPCAIAVLLLGLLDNGGVETFDRLISVGWVRVRPSDHAFVSIKAAAMGWDYECSTWRSCGSSDPGAYIIDFNCQRVKTQQVSSDTKFEKLLAVLAQQKGNPPKRDPAPFHDAQYNGLRGRGGRGGSDGRGRGRGGRGGTGVLTTPSTAFSVWTFFYFEGTDGKAVEGAPCLEHTFNSCEEEKQWWANIDNGTIIPRSKLCPKCVAIYVSAKDMSFRFCLHPENFCRRR